MSHWRESEDGLIWHGPGNLPGRWALRFKHVCPGLYWQPAASESWHGPILGALGLTASGMGEAGNLDESCISLTEIVRDRVELSFMPPGWHETTVRYAWTNTGPHQFDLLAQVSTRSVGMLKGVEVGVVSAAWSVAEPVANWLSATRNDDANKRSMDGRERTWFADQARLKVDEAVTGFGEDREWPPTILASRDEKVRIIETAHPFDISRRYRSEDGCTQRTWTIGYDMERGIILRSRFRARVLEANETPDWDSITNWQNAFLAEPLPLDR